MRVHLNTLGCRLNQGEIDRMARDFAARGDSMVEAPEDADLFVVNTCAVTQEATRSSRQLIYRLNRARPDANIAVTGCYAHIAPDSIAVLPGVSHVIDNFDKEALVSIVTGEPLAAPEVHDREPMQRVPVAGAGNRTRAFIKVQDGCNRQCSFCVTRLARGPERSRACADIVQEVGELTAIGFQEAVLTGVHLGSYGTDRGEVDGLAHLIKAILADTDIPRVRLSSLEPWGIGEDFFRLWQNPRLCRHLHLPLQSGCAATLKRMIRRITPERFQQIVELARAAVPDMAIATDVIVGFPGETETEFAISKVFIESMDFAGMHVFRYSKRPGTAAVRLPGHVSETAKKERSDALTSLSRDQERRYSSRFAGETMDVLWEAVSGATEVGFVNSGYTDNYIRVRHITPRVLTNTITPARLLRYDADRGQMEGTLLA
ncbi:MAG TPA: tRNA (N(6)-L-threonylcarbamoyladenosine(37)-C(2))-methylthiotransferase MtaB [Aggregatilineales bacterium]|nr:tRNA (N(6)-L-threonylcarbamoyladenosine(37)-C(2))-methylthiotransferase MtaB [Aggregatilineales bacterium]